MSASRTGVYCMKTIILMCIGAGFGGLHGHEAAPGRQGGDFAWACWWG